MGSCVLRSREAMCLAIRRGMATRIVFEPARVPRHGWGRVHASDALIRWMEPAHSSAIAMRRARAKTWALVTPRPAPTSGGLVLIG